MVTPHLHYGPNVGPSHRNEYLAFHPKWGVDVLPTTRLARIKDGQGHLLHLFAQTIVEHEFDFIVAGSSPSPRTELLDVLSKLAPTTTAGDMIAPRDAMMAFREGDRLGRTV